MAPAPTTRNWPCFEYSNRSLLKPSENRATKTRRGLKERSRRCEEIGKTGTNVTMCAVKREPWKADPPFVCAKNCTNILTIRPLSKQIIDNELINPDSLYIYIFTTQIFRSVHINAKKRFPRRKNPTKLGSIVLFYIVHQA